MERLLLLPLQVQLYGLREGKQPRPPAARARGTWRPPRRAVWSVVPWLPGSARPNGSAISDTTHVSHVMSMYYLRKVLLRRVHR